MTYNGISEGSVATYTTYGKYLVNGNQTFNTTCLNDEWDPLPNATISITIGTTSGRLCRAVPRSLEVGWQDIGNGEKKCVKRAPPGKFSISDILRWFLVQSGK